ncbi:MAG: type II secretion system protein GspN [Deltaproteobacteria bacterium]|nr:type II secretion system protein GspN [Deltaproteobacteria bacterium]
MTVNRKLLKATLLYVCVGLLALFVFLYIRFPSDMFRNYLIAAVSANHPDFSLSVGDVNLKFPPGLVISKVVLQSKTRSEARLEADSLFIQPVFTSLFNGRTDMQFLARGYGGRMEGTTRHNEAFSLSGPSELSLSFENLPVERVSYLQDFLGRAIRGKLRGSLSFDGSIEKPREGKGKLKFTLLNGSYQIFENLAGFDRIDFNAVDGQVHLSNRILKIVKLTMTGEKLNISMKGDITLGANTFKSSLLNLSGNIEIRTPAIRRIRFTLTGTVENPVTQLS